MSPLSASQKRQICRRDLTFGIVTLQLLLHSLT